MNIDIRSSTMQIEIWICVNGHVKLFLRSLKSGTGNDFIIFNGSLTSGSWKKFMETEECLYLWPLRNMALRLPPLVPPLLGPELLEEPDSGGGCNAEELKLKGASNNSEFLLLFLSGDGDLLCLTGDLFLDIGGNFGAGTYLKEGFLLCVW